MTKSELIEHLVLKNPTLPLRDIENALKDILEQLSSALENGQRVEIRGFGSFSLHFRQPRIGRNPKTGEQVNLDAKSVPYFKAGKELRERIDIHS
ncbi:integration host factor subunit beta [Haemophilus haemoglobinophilus]|nr:integration host factor subunit beta [Canicola haemoglobinophilus]MBN6712125.1 integration host factor subunit beta [Canicola haemoglobinophilus]